MTSAVVVPSVAAVLFLVILATLEIGRRVGAARQARDPEGARAGLGAVEGAVFGLLGLLIAFTFSGATARFDERRHLVVEEANAIGTAYLRLDLLPTDAQPPLRDAFRQYLDSRLATYRKLPDVTAARAELARSIALQGEIWRAAAAASRAAGGDAAGRLLLPALNAMIDITTTRTMAALTHPPGIVFLMLGGLAFASALLSGVAMGASDRRSWLHMLAYAGIMAFTIYVILDIEYPRFGLIRVDAVDRVLDELRAQMH